MEPDVVYFGIEVKPGKTVHLGSGAGASDDDDDDGVSLVHATQVALGPDPAPGRHTVFAVQDGARTPVGTLQAGVCEQFTLDLMWSALAGVPGAAVAFAHSGASPVYVSGYKTVTSLLDDASDGGEPGSDEFESDDDESEESSESEEEEAGARQAVKANGRVRDFDMSSDDDEESDSDDDDDNPFADDSDDASDDWSDEEEAAAAAALGGGGRAPRTPAKPAGGRAASDESGSEEDDDGSLTSGSASDDESDEESGSDESDDEPPPRAGGKRAAPAPAAAPPPPKAAKHQSSDVAAFEAALAAHIRAAGPTKLASLGAAVKKPASLPKLSKWLASNPKFVVDGEQCVSLRK